MRRTVPSCKRSASIELPQRCRRVPPKCTVAAEKLARRRRFREAAHNPGGRSFKSCRDRLLAEEQLGRDLRIGLAVHDEPSDLELTFGQRFKANPVGSAWPRAPVDPVTELPQVTLRLIPIADCSASLERAGGVLQLGCGAVTLVGLGEREAGQLPHRAASTGAPASSAMAADASAWSAARAGSPAWS
jgi:hypothetical protein